MMFKTHAAFAFLVALIGIQFIHPANQVLFLVLVMIGGMLPDIDHPKSKIGKYTPIPMLFEHRGFFHSLLMLPIIAAVLFFAFHLPQYSLPIIIGYASHLFSDMITKEGIMPFHPLSRFRMKGFIKTGGLLEFLILAALIFISGYLLFHI